MISDKVVYIDAGAMEMVLRNLKTKQNKTRKRGNWCLGIDNTCEEDSRARGHKCESGICQFLNVEL